MEKFTKIAAQGALGAGAGIGVLYLAIIWATRPTVTGGAIGATGGFDHVGWQLMIVAMFVPVAILVGVHVAFANDLKSGAKPMHAIRTD